MYAFALNDSKLGEFGQPFFHQSKGLATRFFQDIVRDPKTTINQHPEDFRLYLLATYSPNTGTFENMASPVFIADAVSFMPEPNHG